MKCYVDNGFCELAFNAAHPIATAKFYADLMKVYEVKDFASFIAIKQVALTVKTCGFGDLLA